MKQSLTRKLAAGTILSSMLLMGTAGAQTAGSEDLVKMEKNAANVGHADHHLRQPAVFGA